MGIKLLEPRTDGELIQLVLKTYNQVNYIDSTLNKIVPYGEKTTNIDEIRKEQLFCIEEQMKEISNNLKLLSGLIEIRLRSNKPFKDYIRKI